jgi:hypothetical protein
VASFSGKLSDSVKLSNSFRGSVVFKILIFAGHTCGLAVSEWRNFPNNFAVAVEMVNPGEGNMYVLIFTVCSIVHGANCRELSPLPLDANTQVIGCAIASQMEGAKWVAGHPNYYVQKATCQPAGRFAKL